ncbi:hypothetical protein SETIT_2G154300v2 [Setaria italica]|uniref:Ubiquitin-like protease family profile domain-containing protein n=1 Tax=Setaria italica TaxID=4555 RepID=A0A368PYY9_SETIT|nr:hypothetical protein SETIT_2G154300v2 [Setaria italica]
MALQTYQFNIEEAELREKDNNIVKKFAFSTVLTNKLKIEPENFIQDSLNTALTRLNKTWNLSKMDLDTICFVSAKNVVNNFRKACIQDGVLNKDVSLFDWKYPTDYLQQKTLHDCGLYTMLYMESWNEKKMDTTFQPHMIGNYKKLAAGILLLSLTKEIQTSEFVENYCNQ